MGDTELEERVRRVAEALQPRGLMLVTAESCTGGWVAKAATDLPGSSGWFEGGFVTYTNRAKQGMLGVQPATLQAHGAVSEVTVAEMAAGALDRSAAHVSLAISGVAGPGGGTAEKPVGMVCLGWARKGEAPVTRTEYFEGDRAAVRRAAVRAALDGVLELLGDGP